MRIGILADIHEHVGYLRAALELLRQANVDEVLLLGDIAFDGQCLSETVSLLKLVSPVGVWGNHDLGIACDPCADVTARFNDEVMRFFSGLKPRLIRDDVLFTHGLPSWDATDPLVYYISESPWRKNGLDQEFREFASRIMFAGHFHRWFAANQMGPISWTGDTVLNFDLHARYFVVVDAVFHGAFAILDTDANTLTPYSVRE